MDAFEKELRAARERVARWKNDQSVLDALGAQEAACAEELERCRGAWAREQADVDRLERVSLSSIFHTLAGNKGEQLDKEQAEACAAALKYQAAERQLNEVREEIELRRRRIRENDGCQAAYEQLLRRRAEARRAADPAAARRLSELEERMAQLTARRRELQEALDAGQRVQTAVDALARELDDAGGWSTFDMLGGGLIADLAKYDHLDRAQALADGLQGELRRYQAELSDVDLSAGFSIKVDGFLTAADIFFDNLFTDWAVRDHIRNAQDQALQTRRQVDALQERLAAELSAAEQAQADCQAAWEQAAGEL